MEMMILDPGLQESIIEDRAARGGDRHDEVWDGVYIVSPLPNDEHQDFVGCVYYALQTTIGLPGLGYVRPGVNVSDRDDDWEKNYRCPDVVVYLNETPAINRGTYWRGGPDFLVEVVSKYDKSREKLDFYANVHSREVLIIDRAPWALELYRLVDGEMRLIDKSTLDDPKTLASEVLPLSFRLVAGDPRPRIEIRHSDGVQRWSA